MIIDFDLKYFAYLRKIQKSRLQEGKFGNWFVDSTNFHRSKAPSIHTNLL